MDNTKENENLLTPEEQKAEQEALAEVEDDELRTQLAEKLGIDPEVEGELLDKLVADKKADREKLSGAIKQKINWRKRAESKLEEDKDPKKPTQKKDSSPEDIDKTIDEKLQARLEERDLKSLNLSEDIEKEVKDLAKVKGISVRDAANLPYIQSLIKAKKDEERAENAVPKRIKKGSGVSSLDLSKPLDPASFDFNTKEGVEAWNEAKKARADYMEKSGN